MALMVSILCHSFRVLRKRIISFQKKIYLAAPFLIIFEFIFVFRSYGWNDDDDDNNNSDDDDDDEYVNDEKNEITMQNINRQTDRKIH